MTISRCYEYYTFLLNRREFGAERSRLCPATASLHRAARTLCGMQPSAPCVWQVREGCATGDNDRTEIHHARAQRTFIGVRFQTTLVVL
jgi:hypothetical protein